MSLILSGVMMFDHLGWGEVAKKISHGLEKTIAGKVVTYGLARQMEGARKVKCSEWRKNVWFERGNSKKSVGKSPTPLSRHIHNRIILI